jgi:ribosomal protein S8E
MKCLREGQVCTILYPLFQRTTSDNCHRQPANTRIGAKRVHLVRTRGGNRKFRALRLDTGNFSWGSEAITRKTRVIGVVYHPCMAQFGSDKRRANF